MGRVIPMFDLKEETLVPVHIDVDNVILLQGCSIYGLYHKFINHMKEVAVI